MVAVIVVVAVIVIVVVVAVVGSMNMIFIYIYIYIFQSTSHYSMASPFCHDNISIPQDICSKAIPVQSLDFSTRQTKKIQLQMQYGFHHTFVPLKFSSSCFLAPTSPLCNILGMFCTPPLPTAAFACGITAVENACGYFVLKAPPYTASASIRAVYLSGLERAAGLLTHSLVQQATDTIADSEQSTQSLCAVLLTCCLWPVALSGRCLT
jgi:hypothetical protein